MASCNANRNFWDIGSNKYVGWAQLSAPLQRPVHERTSACFAKESPLVGAFGLNVHKVRLAGGFRWHIKLCRKGGYRI